MNKKINLMLIGLLLASLFVSVVPVISASTQILENPTADANSDGWSYTGTYSGGKFTLASDKYAVPTYKNTTYKLNSITTATKDYTISWVVTNVSDGAYVKVETRDSAGTTYKAIILHSEAGADGWNSNFYHLYGVDLVSGVWNGSKLSDMYSAMGLAYPNSQVYLHVYFRGPMVVDSASVWEHDIGDSVDPLTGDPLPTCGDGTCNGTEDCSTCAADCGSCATYTAVLELEPSLVQLNDKVTGEAYLLKDGTDKVLPDNADSVYIGTNGKNILKLEFDDNNVAEFDIIPSDYPAIFATNQTYSVSVQFIEGADTATGTDTLQIGYADIDNGDYTGDGIGVVEQDGITWIFKFTKDKYTAADFVPNYGAKAGYTVTAVPSSGVNVPSFDTYVDVDLGSENILKNKFIHCLALSSGTNGFTENFYLGTLFSNKDITGHCLLTYSMNGQSKSLDLYANSKFVASGGNSNGGSGDSGEGKTFLGKVWETLTSPFKDVPEKAKETAEKALEAAEDLGKGAWKSLTSVASDVWKGVTSTVSKTAESIVKTVTGGASSGGSLLSGVTRFLSSSLWGIPVIIVIGIVVMIFLFRRGD